MADVFNDVVDLCDSDDDRGHGLKPPPLNAALGVARAPLVVLNDDDDDDSIRIPGSFAAGGGYGNHDGGAQLLDLTDMDTKPAAADVQGSGIAAGSRRRDKRHRTAPRPQSPKRPRRDERPTRERPPLDVIKEVFPDVDPAHVAELMARFDGSMGMVMSELSEGAYPKLKNAPVPDARNARPHSVVVRRAETLPKYDYFSPSAFEPSIEYIVEVLYQLRYEYPFLNNKGIKFLAEKYNNRYSLIQRHVHNAITETDEASKQASEEEEEAHYRALKTALTSKKLTTQQIGRIGQQYVLKRPRRVPEWKPTIRDPVLLDELMHSEKRLLTWMSTVEERLSRLEARKFCELEGSGMECSCCFGEVAMEEMVACRDEGHLFCVGCIKGYAENQIFAVGNLGIDKRTKKPALELLCCHGDGCQSGFQEGHLQKALPFKTLEKYTQMQFKASMEQAGLGDSVCECPECGFKAELPETEMIFRCPVEDCQHESCRKCAKEPHIPLRCDEVDKVKHQDEGRLRVEEAISAAKIRHCPKCKTSFVKSDGCNKMSCPCGVKVCYICRGVLDKRDPYKHFCQTPHCKHDRCGKCALHTNDEEDDKRAMREAGVSAAAAFKDELSAKQKEGGADVGDISIDIDQIMRVPDGRATSRAKLPRA